MRRAARRLRQGPHNGAAGQIDLESVVGMALGVAQQRVGRAHEGFALRRPPVQRCFDAEIAPGLVGDAAEGQPHTFDCLAVKLERGGNRNQREGVRQPVADFQIGVIFGETLSWELDGGDVSSAPKLVSRSGVAPGRR